MYKLIKISCFKAEIVLYLINRLIVRVISESIFVYAGCFTNVLQCKLVDSQVTVN
jgi:hypothetical protein